MKHIIVSLISCMFFIPAQSQTNMFSLLSWEQVTTTAIQDNKLIFVELLGDNGVSIAGNITFTDELEIYPSNFVYARLSSNDPAYESILKKYQVKTFPSYIYLNTDGTLLLPVSQSTSTTVLLQNAQLAIAQKYEKAPLAQLDLHYKQNNLDKTSLYEYIKKRTARGLDNADIIDEYVRQCSVSEIINEVSLPLLFLKNNCNVYGSFVDMVEKERELTMKVLKINDYSYSRRIFDFNTYTFNKVCEQKDEKRLESLIALKVNNSPNEDPSIIKNEMFAKYYYKTKQPLKLANFATAYADAVMKSQVEMGENADSEMANSAKNFISENKDEFYAKKLCNAAQYVAETLSNKASLNNALNWTLKATEMFNSFTSYETQAYILYKLGKRSEAITCMEKATVMVPKQNNSQVRDLCVRLVQMKRGERIF